MADQIDTAQLAETLEQISQGLIDVSEGARRLGILEAEPARYPCGTCQHFRRDTCYQPGQPPRPEHPASARCGAYRPRPDERDMALPAASPRKERCMWK